MRKAFTLIELLVVIIIIGILSAIAIPVFLHQRKKGWDAAAKQDLRNLAGFQEIYFLDTQMYGTIAEIQALEPKAAVSKVKTDNADVQAGVNIVLRALEAPIRQIAENAGVEGSIVVGKINDNKSATFGFNAQTEEFVDMLSAGIVDPAKVVRTALQDAASVAGLLVTTEAMVAELPKKDAAPAMPGGGMGGMDF